MRRLLLLPLLLLVGCKPDTSKARRALASLDPAERKEAASVLQKAYRKDPMSVGDHGEAYWKARLARVDGTSTQESMRILGAPQPGGSEGGGGGATDNYRLDAFWLTTLFRDTRNDTTFGHEPPRRFVEHVDVERPARFTGTWTTYYVSGAVFEDLELEGGLLRHDREYHETGQLRCERFFVDGKAEGTFVCRYPNGAPESEDTYAKGKQVGVHKRFYPNGKLQYEAHYADDKLDGRSRDFNESGAVTYCAEYRAGVQLDGGCDER